LRVVTRLAVVCGVVLCGLASGIAAARAESLSQADRQAYRSAFAAARNGDFAAAERQASHVGNPLLAKVVLWLEYTRSSGPRFSDIAEFLSSNPDWPGETAMRQRAEEAIAAVPDVTARDWLAKYPPITAYGRLRQAELAMQANHQAAAVAEIRDVWINSELSAFDEKSILQRYGSLIRGEDHIKRLDRLAWDGLGEAAKRQMVRVPQEYRLLADARLKLAAFQPGVERAVAKVPAEFQNDPGLLYERLRWRRRKDQYDSAIEILLSPPRDLVRPELWWVERQTLARHVLADGKAQLAYRLVSNHGLIEGPAHADAEFLAGWIALRFLHQPQTAYDHFVRLYNSVTKPISRARGAYWAARAAGELKSKALATSWFNTAADFPMTYYGQLATTQLGGDPAARLAAEPKPTAEELAHFHRLELVRVIEMLSEIGEDDRIAAFQHRLSEVVKTPDQHVMIAMLAEQINRPELAVGAAKRAGYAGVSVVSYGYPVIELPRGDGAERPLVLAMTRQESAFERTAVSRSGARGLMQLMPATAKQIAKARQMPFSADRLLTDGRYNLAVGRAYLDDLLDRFAGSYILSIAAYNAGPGRVREWMDTFGDPRTKSIDAVDWIEAIPFSETRNYVQRVLENLQVYRFRLGGHPIALVENNLQQ
jgi:soluble lytic murein transglycosylase